MAMYCQAYINSVSLCSLGLCYGHRVVRVGSASDESTVLEDVSESRFPRDTRLGRTMTNDDIVLDDAVTKIVEGKNDFVDALEKDNADAIVRSVIDAIEHIGINVRAQFTDMEDEDDDDDDFDWEGDDDDDDVAGSEDEDDRWPGDTDEDE